MEILRKKIKYFNMRLLAEESGVSYSILKNFSSGRTEHLNEKQFNQVVKAIHSLTI